MAFKFFIVPIQNGEAAEAELNTFMRNNTVLSVERRWVDQGATSFWTFCIDYLDAAGGKGARRSGRRGQVDYQEILNEQDFAVYAKLRDLRKEIAQAEGIPVYAVFNNEHLAKMVQNKARTKEDLEAIAGVGDARVEKFGSRFADFLTQHWEATNEKDGESV